LPQPEAAEAVMVVAAGDILVAVEDILVVARPTLAEDTSRAPG